MSCEEFQATRVCKWVSLARVRNGGDESHRAEGQERLLTERILLRATINLVHGNLVATCCLQWNARRNEHV
jgi:hypothetical protein